MSFTVETGAGLSNANSYVSVADADTFHTDRGNTDWAGLDNSEKQSMLIRATDYIDQTYGPRFIGEQSTSTQALEWPRSEIDNIAYNVIPSALKQAVCVLALEAIEDDLNPSQSRGGAVKREKVDVIEVEYLDNAPATTKRPAIDGLLRKLLLSSSPFNAKVVRV